MSNASIGSLARRYARALIDLAGESRQADDFGTRLQGLLSVFHQDAELLYALSSDTYPETERTAAIAEVADKIGAPLLLKNFLLLLTHKYRLGLLPEIVREYNILRDEILGIVRVVVTAPRLPDQAMLGRVEKLLGERLKKKIICTGEARPEILGGLVLQVDHTIYDGSVVRELERIKERMLAA